MSENIEFRPIDRSQHEVLVVDDDPASRYATVRQLRSAGFRTREAATGAEGLKAADEWVSAMVLDVHLPDIDGFELCRRLRSRPSTARLPVLHLSAAYVTTEDKVRGLDAGADAYLTHPVEPAVLIATVQALVRTHVAEDAMRRSEAQFRAIYAQAPGGICLLDRHGHFIDANPAMLALLGRELPAVAGHALSEFVPAEFTALAQDYIRQVGLTPVREEFPVLDAAGQPVPLEWTASEHLEPGVIMAVVADISQRMQLAQQRQELLDRERIARGAAERMSRMKDELIAVLSHELRTPLNAIMGWAHVLQLRGGSEENLRGLAAIERNGRIQARMISDILDMSRLNMGKLPLQLETVDPAEVVGEAVRALQPSIESSKHTVRVDLAPAYRPIQADSARLQQVLWNLLSNAIKFAPPGSEILVTVTETPEGLHIAVADPGQGIEPDFLPFLFDRFSQSDAGSNRRRGGLGLGLSIVKQLVEAHGGTVSAFSEGAGRGSVFNIFLPLVAPAASAEEPAVSLFGELDSADEPDASLGGVRVLLVDDDAEACAMLAIILSDRGATVRLAEGFEQALQALDEFTPDVMVSDVGMPGKDGYDLIREVRRREALKDRRLPAIALTSFSRSQDHEQAIQAGFDVHCAKPLKPLQLVREINQLTGRAEFRE